MYEAFSTKICTHRSLKPEAAAADGKAATVVPIEPPGTRRGLPTGLHLPPTSGPRCCWTFTHRRRAVVESALTVEANGCAAAAAGSNERIAPVHGESKEGRLVPVVSGFGWASRGSLLGDVLPPMPRSLFEAFEIGALCERLARGGARDEVLGAASALLGRSVSAEQLLRAGRPVAWRRPPGPRTDTRGRPPLKRGHGTHAALSIVALGLL